MILSNKTKCLTCPYKLGKVKCVENPYLNCIVSKRKDNPFEIASPEVVRKNQKRKK